MSSALVPVPVTPPPQMVVRAEDYMPLFTPDLAIQRKDSLNKIIANVLVEGQDRDYSAIPGAGQKKILLKPGAEKLATTFGLTPAYVPLEEIEDWTGKDHDGEALFYYKYRCQLWRGDRLLGEAIGSCNSWESKYRYRWISAEEATQRGLAIEGLLSRGGIRTLSEFEFSIEKAETTGQYGKPAEYWQGFRDAIQSGVAKKVKKKTKANKEFDAWEYSVDTKLYRIPNPEFADIINTCQKMAQKRALVAAVLVATNASDSFSQDLEDFQEPSGTGDIDTGGHPVGTQAAANHVGAQKVEQLKAEANDPPEVKKLIAKAAKPGDDRKEVFADLYGELKTLVGEEKARAVWARLSADNATYQAIIRGLYQEIQTAKSTPTPELNSEESDARADWVPENLGGTPDKPLTEPAYRTDIRNLSIKFINEHRAGGAFRDILKKHGFSKLEEVNDEKQAAVIADCEDWLATKAQGGRK